MMKKGWSWTLWLAGGHFWVDFYFNMIMPLLPVIAFKWDLVNSQLALVVSLSTLFSNLLQPVFGFLVDKRLRYWMPAVALAVIALPMGFIYLADSYHTFILMILVAGLGGSLYHPVGANLVVVGPNEDKALKMSVYSCFGSFGYALAPAIVAYILGTWGIKYLTYIMLPGLIWVIAVRMFGKEKILPDVPKAHTPVVNESPRTYLPLLLLCTIITLRSWLATVCSVFIPLWLVGQGVGEKAAGLQLTVLLLAGTLGGIVCGYLYPKCSVKKILVYSFLCTLLLLPVYFYAAAAWRSFILAAIGFCLMGTNPVTIVLGQELLPGRGGLASGMTMGFSHGVAGLGTYLTGLAADYIGGSFAVLLTSLVLIPALIITGYLSRFHVEGVRIRKDTGVSG